MLFALIVAEQKLVAGASIERVGETFSSSETIALSGDDTLLLRDCRLMPSVVITVSGTLNCCGKTVLITGTVFEDRSQLVVGIQEAHNATVTVQGSVFHGASALQFGTTLPSMSRFHYRNHSTIRVDNNSLSNSRASIRVGNLHLSDRSSVEVVGLVGNAMGPPSAVLDFRFNILRSQSNILIESSVIVSSSTTSTAAPIYVRQTSLNESSQLVVKNTSLTGAIQAMEFALLSLSGFGTSFHVLRSVISCVSTTGTCEAVKLAAANVDDFASMLF